MKRKKRLEKGIDSLEEQIELHKEKWEKSKEEGNIELEGYYQREINSLENVKKRKEKQLDR